MELKSSTLGLVIATALVAGLAGGVGGLWLNSKLDLVSGAQPRMVTFNVTRLINAERAVASGLLGPDKNSNAALVIARVSKTVRAVIRAEAGVGTTVLVKQGVVSRNLPDITTKVLTSLGLPTKVPAATPMEYATNIAPTDLSYSQLPAMQRATVAEAWNRTRQTMAKTQLDQNQAALP